MNLGFSCLAIDPITKYKNDWARTRPNAKLLNIALGDQEGEVEMTVFEDDDHAEKRQQSNDMFSTLSPSSAKHASATSKKERVSIRRAENVFREENLSEIGILSIDVEGFELQVISGIDFTKTSIHIAVIENNTDSRLGSENIRAHMKSVGFKFYARIWGMDDIYVNINSPAFRME